MCVARIQTDLWRADLAQDRNQKRVILIGSSFSAAPIFFSLKRRGLWVTVCGNIKSDPCHGYADESVYLDYSVKENLLDYVSASGFDYIVPSCNDYSYVSASWVANHLGLPGFDAYPQTTMLHTKDNFRSFCEKWEIPHPSKFFHGEPKEAEGLVTGLSYPVLVKPVDSFSGRGVSKVFGASELGAAIALAGSASRTGQVVVEEFLPGTLHSHTAFIEDGSIIWDGFADEYCTVYPYQVNCSNCPTGLPLDLQRRVRATMQKVVSAATLADGLLHTQFINQGSDFWIIECMRRCPGDLYGQLIERATGLNYTDMYAAKFLGERYRVNVPSSTVRAFVGRHTISVDSKCVAAGFSMPAGADGFAFVPLKESGQILDAAPYDKLGILFATFPTVEQMHGSVSRFADVVTVASLENDYGRYSDLPR